MNQKSKSKKFQFTESLITKGKKTKQIKERKFKKYN